MKSPTWRVCVARALFFVTVITPLGCKKGQPASGTSGPSPTEEVARVELSDPQVTVLEPQKIRASIKYRFTQGQPAAGTWYACMLELTYSDGQGGGVAMLTQAEGTQLKAEGVLQTEFGLFKPIPPGETASYVFEMKQGPQHGRYNKSISNVVKGTIR